MYITTPYIGGKTMADGNAPKRIFLRKILYRLDFQLITERLQEEIFQYTAEKYSNYFSIQESEQANAIDLEINPINPSFSRMNSKTQNIFILSQPRSDTEDGCTIKIGKTFIYLELNLNIISKHISYLELFSDIVNYIKKNQMFRPTRLGIRKFNLFYILDENKKCLNQIFKTQLFSDVKANNFVLDQAENVQVYNSNDYILNFSHGYSTGNLSNATIANKLAHLISFDFDMYSINKEVLNRLLQHPTDGLLEINKNIYDFFSCVINDEVIEQLNKGVLSLEKYCIIPY